MSLTRVPESVQSVEETLQEHRVYCIASGEEDKNMKFYMYAQQAAGKVDILLELQILNNALQATIKSADHAAAEKFKKLLEAAIGEGFK